MIVNVGTITLGVLIFMANFVCAHADRWHSRNLRSILMLVVISIFIYSHLVSVTTAPLSFFACSSLWHKPDSLRLVLKVEEGPKFKIKSVLKITSEVLELGIHDLQKCGLSGKETSIVQSFVGQIESGLCHIRLMSGVFVRK